MRIRPYYPTHLHGHVGLQAVEDQVEHGKHPKVLTGASMRFLSFLDLRNAPVTGVLADLVQEYRFNYKTNPNRSTEVRP